MSEFAGFEAQQVIDQGVFLEQAAALSDVKANALSNSQLGERIIQVLDGVITEEVRIEPPLEGSVSTDLRRLALDAIKAGSKLETTKETKRVKGRGGREAKQE